jgi:hypothetical protein
MSIKAAIWEHSVARWRGASRFIATSQYTRAEKRRSDAGLN